MLLPSDRQPHPHAAATSSIERTTAASREPEIRRRARTGSGVNPFCGTISLLVTASDININALYIVVIVLAKRHGASSTLVGGIVAFIGVGGLIGATIAPWTSRRLSARVAIATTLSAMTLLLPLLLVTKTPILLGLIYGGMFVAYPTWSAIHWAYFAALVPDQLQGRVQSIATLLSLLDRSRSPSSLSASPSNGSAQHPPSSSSSGECSLPRSSR